tara:strand:- start:245 stop:910 length:666 start_codon:yes stop_codon:yes gene_type:complete
MRNLKEVKKALPTNMDQKPEEIKKLWKGAMVADDQSNDIALEMHRCNPNLFKAETFGALHETVKTLFRAEVYKDKLELLQKDDAKCHLAFTSADCLDKCNGPEKAIIAEKYGASGLADLQKLRSVIKNRCDSLYKTLRAKIIKFEKDLTHREETGTAKPRATVKTFAQAVETALQTLEIRVCKAVKNGFIKEADGQAYLKLHKAYTKGVEKIEGLKVSTVK